MKRLAAACLVSPLWVPFFAALWAASTLPLRGISGMSSGSWMSAATAVGAMVGYAGIVILGIPAHLFLRQRYPSLWAYLAIWFGVGLAAWAIMFFGSFASYGLRPALAYLTETIVHRPHVPITIAAVWALVGMTFWLIVRPDKLVSAPPSAIL
jgi:hypothetical protein